jgi:hypothetical protein
MAKNGRSYNDSIGQSREHKTTRGMADEEVTEAEDYGRNINKSRGHLPDSRFDEGSTHGIESAKIVRPSTGNYANSKFHGYLKGKK